MSVVYLDPYKLTLKEVEEVILSYNLQSKLETLMSELSRMNYEGYIKLSKPKNTYHKNDWQKILEVLQSNIIEAKNQNNVVPLPEFLEKKLDRILLNDNIQEFSEFINSYSNYLPKELFNERNNIKFLSWLYSKLRCKKILLYSNQIRLGDNVNPDDLLY